MPRVLQICYKIQKIIHLQNWCYFKLTCNRIKLPQNGTVYDGFIQKENVSLSSVVNGNHQHRFNSLFYYLGIVYRIFYFHPCSCVHFCSAIHVALGLNKFLSCLFGIVIVYQYTYVHTDLRLGCIPMFDCDVFHGNCQPQSSSVRLLYN